MEGEDQYAEEFFPASPTSECINSSALSLGINVVFETEIPIDDSQAVDLLRELFLPLNPRFSCVLLRDSKGYQKWRRVPVRLDEHVKTPRLPQGLERGAYESYLRDYITKLASERLEEDRPLWEIHLFKYPTREAEGAIIFKLHHALGDGFSLMGALFSCLKRADDPSLPLTFPAAKVKEGGARSRGMWRRAFGAVSACWNTTSDFSRSVLKSTVWEDGKSAIRSGSDGVEHEPTLVTTVTLSLHDIRQVKSKIGGTVNDVVVGTIFYGLQLYKERIHKYKGPTASSKSWSSMTALVLLNTRMANRYQTAEDMLRKKTWGNHFTFLHVSIPSCKDAESVDPLSFVFSAKRAVRRQKNSLAIFLTAAALQVLRCIKGPQAASRFVCSTIKNTSTAISYLNGPLEKIEMGRHPIKSFYFFVSGVPNSLTLTIVSYMGHLRMAITGEKDFIDSQLITSCMREAFDEIYSRACGKGA